MQVRPQTNPVEKIPGAEPLPGYRLLAPLGTGGFGEVWKCEAPGGMHKAIKFVRGADGNLLGDNLNGAEQELRALQHVKSLRHPFLLSLERVEHVGGELVIVMELADRSLHDLLAECQQAGLPGVPRMDLLLYLRETAEVLDLLNLEHGLQHLDIKPRNLFLVGGHVKVADFGLVNSLAELTGHNAAQLQLGAVTPLYAAPESFLCKISLFSDQYSLAVAYCELLTGKLPFTGKNFRQLMLQHTQNEPDLGDLPESDRRVVARALAKDPRGRFPSSLEFVRQLIGQERPTLPASETAAPASKAATMHDLCLVEKARTRSVPRPTRVQERKPGGGRPLTPAAAAAEQARVCVDDFHFIDCLGRSPLGEMWKAETAEGATVLVKLVNTFTQGGMFGDEDPAAQLQALKHRGLLTAVVTPHPPNRLAVITPLVTDSLATRLQRCREEHLPGIPRDELLGHLLAAAVILDDLHKIYGTQHLGLNPRCLLLHGDKLVIADYGLMALVWLPAGQAVSQINPRYCPPESAEALGFNPGAGRGGRGSSGGSGGLSVLRHCDQYSLALIYHELLTGMHLFGNMTQRQLALARTSGRLSLDLLSAPDRGPVGRALHPEAGQRFRSCTDFVRALQAAMPGDSLSTDEADWTELGGPRPQEGPLLADVLDRDGGRIIAELIAAAAGTDQVREFRAARYSLRPGEHIDHTCYARLVPGTLSLKLAGFCRDWQADVVSDGTDTFVFRTRLQSSFWKRCLGKQPGLEVTVKALTAGPHATLTDLLVRIVPSGCGPDEGACALEKHGPPLLDNLRSHLQAGPERRAQPRLPFERPLRVSPVLANKRLGEAFVCQGKDISLAGIGLYLPCKPPSSLVLQLQRSPTEPPVSVAADLVRSQPCGDGRFEAGLRFQSFL